MNIIYTLITYTIFATLSFTLYSRILREKLQSKTLITGIFFLTLYRAFFPIYVTEPFHLILGISGLATVIRIFERKVILPAFVLSILFALLARISAALITSVTFAILGVDITSSWLWIAASIADIIIFTLVYKFIRIKNGIPTIRHWEIQGIIFSITGIVLIGYGLLFLLFELETFNTPLIITLSSLATIGLLLLAFLVYSTVSYRERKKLEKRVLEVKHAFDEMASTHHKYRHIVPNLMTASKGLSEELVHIIGAPHDKQVRRLENYISTINKLSSDISNEFYLDDLIDEIAALELADDWLDLELYLNNVMLGAQRKGILVQLENRATTWDDLEVVNRTDFLRLFSNLLDNAVKESDKTEMRGKQVTVEFFDCDDGYFAFEVVDYAHEFSLDILSKLGERKNSTNGTGDGYAEVFEILQKYDISFHIKEKQLSDTLLFKRVGVIFDEMGRKSIESSYRSGELIERLSESGLEVITE